jgi:hypothetical protein
MKDGKLRNAMAQKTKQEATLDNNLNNAIIIVPVREP